ncbi:MAG: GNAT family N-acetyltransferase [Chitinophagales bacterium]
MSIQLLKTKKELAQAATVFSTSFLNYPLYTYLFPDIDQRKKLLPILFEISATYLSEFVYGITHVGSVQAVLLMDSPNKKEPSLKSLITILRRYGYRLPFRKSIKMLSIFNKIHQAQPKSNFFYIQTIAVDPTNQGGGFGKEIINFVKELAGNQPIYLETNDELNVAYYQKRGFVLYKEFICDKSKELKTWSMIWPSNKSH